MMSHNCHYFGKLKGVEQLSTSLTEGKNPFEDRPVKAMSAMDGVRRDVSLRST
jgi:hypothetical protein